MPAEAPAKRGRPRSEAAEQAMLDAAIELLAEHGYGGLTVEAVAARAGVAKTTVYRRWPGKDELLIDALNTVKGPLAQLPGGTVEHDLKWLMEHMREAGSTGNHGRDHAPARRRRQRSARAVPACSATGSSSPGAR